ncbi:stress protein [Streptomyces sp. NRRL B-1677]|uniref:Stress protein n=1 Tax=Streptomyces klenkii TaxID=1420899 RepID=A0A3B0BVQ6_9ACTN|nr:MULTISPECIES: TerD family protein [Streptomyces]MBF6048994.1 stress protein [Streptomyces sp. NRRL B-1677]RKN76279.1 stress protein [Streptomyces klenkii]
MAREFQRGHKAKISDLTAGTDLYVGVQIAGPGLTFDISCFGLDAAERLSDDRYFIFFNQPKSPEGAVQQLGAQAGDTESFRVTLDQIPPQIQRLTFTATLDGAGRMSQTGPGYLRIVAGGQEVARYSFTGSEFSTERAVMLGDIYLKDVWRFAAVGQGFDGGLEALLRNFGGEVLEEEPEPQAAQAPQAAPAQAPAAAPAFAPPQQTTPPPAFAAPAAPAPAPVPPRAPAHQAHTPPPHQGFPPPPGSTPPPAPPAGQMHAAPTLAAGIAPPGFFNDPGASSGGHVPPPPGPPGVPGQPAPYGQQPAPYGQPGQQQPYGQQPQAPHQPPQQHAPYPGQPYPAAPQHGQPYPGQPAPYGQPAGAPGAAGVQAALQKYREVPTGQRWTLQNPKLVRVDLGVDQQPVLARQGSMVLYQGKVEFGYKGAGFAGRIVGNATGQELQLMRCTGRGQVFLAETAAHVHPIELQGDALCVSAESVLAFDESLQHEVRRIEGHGIPGGALFTMQFQGHGTVVVKTHGTPVVLPVTPSTYVDSNAIVAWSAGAQVIISSQVRLRRSSFPGHSGEAVNLQFRGAPGNFVVVQPYEV